MKISALRLFNVKRFASRGVAIEGIGEGVNVLCAENEFGKSTSFEALHALFFQAHTGTPGDVQKLRPYSGGSPLVEADIATSEGRFRITKQYYGGRSVRVIDLRSGRVVAQADEAENMIAGLVRGGTAGPAGLLWVRQGMTGIEKRTRSEEDGETQVRASLLESVQGEVEAITGGRRMAQIMAAARDALALLVTPTGRAKAGGRYAAALEDRDRLAADETKLAAEMSDLRGALDRRAADTRRLAELDRAEDRHERRAAIDAAQAAVDAAKIQGEALKAAEAELKLARERRKGAGRDLDAFREARARAGELEVDLRAAEAKRREAVARRRQAVDAIGAARAEADAAEDSERDARDLLARLDAALRAREAAERLAGLQERLRETEAIRAAIEKGEAAHALVKIAPGAIDDVQNLEIEIAKRRAVEEAGRPSVTVEYKADAAGAVTMEGIALAGGEERSYDAAARLALPGIGTITLRSNRPPTSDAGLERAEDRRRTMLAAMGVDDLAAARERQARAQRLDADLRELRARLSLMAPNGLAALREEVAALGAIAPGALELKAEPDRVRASLAEAVERRARARAALQETEPSRASAESAFVRAETMLASLSTKLAQVEATLGPAETREERERILSGSLDGLARGLASAEADAQVLRAAVADFDMLAARLARARSVETAAESEIKALRERIIELNAVIRTRSDEAVEETWREAADALAAASSRVRAFEKEVAVLQRLSSALERARSEARELYLTPVMAELAPLLRLLFDDVSITFDDRTLLPQTIRRNGQDEDIDRLSGGMREQLSVLTRLAFARLLARDGRPAPVILDDALVYSDDDRIEKMFDALHRQSRDQQIIVFSCRQRAFQKLGGNILRMTDWQP